MPFPDLNMSTIFNKLDDYFHLDGDAAFARRLPTAVPKPGDTVQVALPLPDGGYLLNDLTDFARKALGFADWVDLLAEFPLPNRISLTRLEAGFGNKNGGLSLSGLFAAFQWSNFKWEPVPGITLEQPGLTVSTLFFDGDAPDSVLTIYGTIEVAGIPFTLMVSPALKNYRAFMNAGQVVSLEPLLQLFQLDGLGFDGAQISQAELSGELDPASLTFHVTVEDGFTLNVGVVSFKLTTLDLLFKHFSQPINFTAAAIGADFRINDDLALNLIADYAGPDSGWELTGSLETELSFDALVKAIKNQFRLSSRSLSPPALAADLRVTGLRMTLNTRTGAATFSIKGKAALIDKDIDASVDINLTPVPAGGYDIHFSGQLLIAELAFDLIFDKAPDAAHLIAVYENHGGGQIDVGNLAAAISGNSPIAGLDQLRFALKSAMLAVQDQPKGWLLALDIDAGVNLSNLPLIGKLLPSGETLRLMFTPIVASTTFDPPAIKAIEKVAPDKAPALPAQGIGPALSLFTTLQIGDLRMHLDYAPAAPTGTTISQASQRVTSGPEQADRQVGFGGSSPAPPRADVKLGARRQIAAWLSKIWSRFYAARQDQLAPVAAGRWSDVGPERAPEGEPAKPPALSPMGAGALGEVRQPSPGDQTKWFDIQKSFGPIHFERIGLQLNLAGKDQRVDILLTGALQVAGLTLALDGLGATYSLANHSLRFSLRGLGLEYGQGPVEVAGAFLNIEDDFAGLAMLRTETFGVSAMGAYSNKDGKVSLFVYAFLDYPIGGPSFFFVEGLAAGFGYNRRLVVPPVDQLRSFPLVAAAVGDVPASSKLTGPSPDITGGITEELEKLHGYLSPQAGEYFLAAGIKFNSFRLIDCFALLTVSFGNHLEVDVIGIATMQVPAEAPNPIAKVQMAFRASIDPQAGELSVQAQLTSESFILSPQCHLFGGYAFATWFLGDYAGDFVYTLGGYHPHFVPDHYPVVPRLAFHWDVDSQTTIKGDCYYALTPSAAMAGGNLQATWEGENVSAWFTMGADFLMVWKPLHYEASAYVEIGAEITIHFFGRHRVCVNAGADLELWGPPFSGVAHVHLKVIGVKVNFTVSFEHGSRGAPPKLSWGEFQKSFLPKDASKMCAIAIRGGLLRTVKDKNGDTRWIINPKEFCLTTDSLIPSTGAGVIDYEGTAGAFPTQKVADLLAHNPGYKRQPGGEQLTKFGILPMRLAPDQFESTQIIRITREQANISQDFAFVPITKQVPTAMWSARAGSANRPDLNAATTMQTLTGYALHPHKPPTPGASIYIGRNVLGYEVTVCSPAQDHAARMSFARADQPLQDALTSNQTSKDWLKALGFDPATAVRLGGTLAGAFVRKPQVVSIA